MDVGSSFGIYGTLFGWYANNQLLGFIVLTGLWIIPFFFILYSATFGNRGGGEGHNYNPMGTLVTLEIQIYVALFVIALFLNPMVSVNKTNFLYDNGSSVETAGATGTTFDTMVSTMPDTVKIPPAWYGIMVFTHGFNKVFKQILPTGTKIRQLMHQVKQLKITDDGIRNEYETFQQNCMLPASKRYSALLADHSDSVLARDIKTEFDAIKTTIAAEKQNLSEEWKINPLSAGNVAYTTHGLYRGDDYYCKQTTSDPQGRGTGTKCLPLGLVPVTPHEVQPGLNCADWWNGASGLFAKDGLKKQIQGDINQQIADNDSWLHINPAIVTFFQNSDKALFSAISRSNLDDMGATKGLNNKDGGKLQWIGEKMTAVFGSAGNIFNEMFATTVIRFALPVLHGVIILFLVIILPILIIFGRYQAETVASLGILFFGLLFLPGIWHVISWLDQILLKAIWGDQNWLASTMSMGRVAWDMVILGSYGFLTYIWIMMIHSMGASAARSLSSSLSGAGAMGGTASAIGGAGVRKGGGMALSGGKSAAGAAGNKAASVTASKLGLR